MVYLIASGSKAPIKKLPGNKSDGTYFKLTRKRKDFTN